VSEKYFFDTSAFLSIVKNEPLGINVSSLIDSLNRAQCYTSVYHAKAMTAARIFQYSKGAIDPLLAAQCIDGGYTMVTANLQDFERVPGLKIAQL